MNKKFILVLILLVLFSISAVNAENINSTDINSLDASMDENIAVDNSTQNLGSTNSNEVIGAGEIYVNGSVSTSGDGSQTSPFKTLSEALNVVNNGDTIYIASGIYTGQGLNVGLTISNEITLTTYGDEPVIFDGQKLSSILNINISNVKIIGITFVNGNYGNNAGAIEWNGDNGTLTNCTFLNSTAYYSGGAIYWVGNGGVLDNCTFINSTASNGAVYWRGENGVLTNCTFLNSTAYYSGGAIYWVGNGGVLDNCTFINSTARNGAGGAIYWVGNGGVLDNCTFINSTARNSGAINWSGNEGTLINCTFINSTTNIIYNYNNGYGGAIEWNGDNGTLTNCTFINSTIKKNGEYGGVGGAIYWNSDGGVLTNCSFINSISSDGGAVYWRSKNGVLTNCSFINSISGDGGAVYWYGNNGTLTNCTFLNSTAYYSGGAIYWDNGGGSTYGDIKMGFLANCSFINSISGNGGAVYWCSENGVLTNCSFINSTTYYSGGTVYWRSENGVLTNCIFINASARNSDGGAVYWGGDDGILTNCIFINSTANYTDSPFYWGGNGGAVYWHGENGVLTNCSFINSTCSSYRGGGGAIYLFKNYNVLTNCIFINSSALNGGVGGAIYLVDKYNVLANCTFLNSTANDGGAIYLSGSNVLANCTFLNSSANDGGAIYWYDNSGNIVNSIFINNSASNNGNAIYFNSQFGGSYVSNNIFINNYGSDYDIYGNVGNQIYANYNWFGNTYYNRTVTPKTNVINSIWLYLNCTLSDCNLDVGDRATAKYSLNNYYDSSDKSVGYYDASNVPLSLNVSSIGGYTNVTNITFVNGGASVLYTSSEAGDNLLTVSIASFSFTENLDISFIIDAPDFVKYCGGSERFVVTVIDKKGTPVEGQLVFITINGKNYNRTTDKDGKAGMNIGLSPNVYPVTVQADVVVVNTTATVLTTVNGTDVTKTYKNGTQYWATFRDTQGNYLPIRTYICYNINGVFYDRQVIADKGLARLNINLDPGTYILTAMNPVTGEMSSNTVTVLAQIADNHDLTKYFRNDSQYRVKVLDKQGKAVGAGENVTFNINGVFYNRQTDADGYVQLRINLDPGDYIITAMYGDSMVSNNVKVLPIITASDLTKKYGESEPFKATIVDSQGRPAVGHDVTFNINGVMYHRTSDSEGVARLNINLNAGEYIITSMYNDASIGNTVIVTRNPEKEYIYIDLPSYDTTTTQNIGNYKIEILQWRSPGICEVDIMVSDSSGGFVNKYDIESRVFDGTTWFGPYTGFPAATYHKWHFDPDVRITQVALKIKGLNW